MPGDMGPLFSYSFPFEAKALELWTAGALCARPSDLIGSIESSGS